MCKQRNAGFFSPPGGEYVQLLGLIQPIYQSKIKNFQRKLLPFAQILAPFQISYSYFPLRVSLRKINIDRVHPQRRRWQSPSSNKMVFLHQQKSSLKRDSSSSSKSTFPVPPSKIPKSVDSEIEKMVSILADAGCTLMYHSGPPCLPSDPNKFRRHLANLLSHDSSLRSHFLAGFSSYVQSPKNFNRSITFSFFIFKIIFYSIV